MSTPTPTSTIDHPALSRVKATFPDVNLMAAEFRGQTSLIAPSEHAHRILRFLRDDPECDYDFLADVTAVDYLGYPVAQPGRFAVVWVLKSERQGRRLIVKSYVDPEGDTSGNAKDPGLVVDSVCDIWPGAEWREREAYDMFGITFRGHPDLRRILMWEDYPAFPLRKDYPLRGRGERERHDVMGRTEE